MCGIAGIVNLTGAPLSYALAIRQMSDQIVHRGPDDEGIFANEQIAFGHRRLSILDLSEAGRQPMWDVTGRFVIVFNGEIYNYRELKKALPGYAYRTQSDTEIILAYFSTYGANCLQYFNGMFAFAIWDTEEKELFMARDRLGKKPFYYFMDNETFIFCSEVRGILKSELINASLEHGYLAEYLQYQSTMGPHTLVKGIRRLNAGCYAVLKNHDFSERPFWQYDQVEASADHAETARKRVHDLLMDAVRLRMVSDVPVGAFLSGGIDSSLVVACMAGQSMEPVETFTLGFKENTYDETKYADQIARQFNTRHHHIEIAPKAFLDSLEDIFDSMDMPSGDGPNTYLVSLHARKSGIKVAMSGLGGDELFAGYNKFFMYQRLARNQNLLRWPKIVRLLGAQLLTGFRTDSRTTKMKELAVMQQWRWEDVYPIIRQAYSHKEVSHILSIPGQMNYMQRHLADLASGLSHIGNLGRCTIAELEMYTRDVLLRDTDQMSMHHSLEVRVPFFDYRLVEYLISLPDDVKDTQTPKQLLTSSFEGWLPLEITQRKKMGFTLPIDTWLRTVLAAATEEKLKYLADRQEFNGKVILKKWNQFMKGDPAVLWTRIWKLLVLADWLERNKL